jgi:hypothetical protein
MLLPELESMYCDSQANRSLSSTARKFAYRESGSAGAAEGRLPYSVFA